MLEHIKYIKVKGGPFTEHTSLELLPSRLNLMYGRNGSGKSTIAKCIKRLGKEDDGSGYSAATAQVLSEDALRRVYVFDEDFVSDNLRMEDEEGLNSIVMIGEQVGLDETLKDLLKKQTDLKSRQDQISKELDLYTDKNDPKSPLWHKNEIIKKLRADGGWADKDKKIRGNQIKTAVTDEIFKELLNLKVSRSLEDLQKEFDEKIQTLSQIQRNGSKLETIPCNVLFQNIEAVKFLLDKHIREPYLSESDKKIIELVQSEYGSYLEHVHPVFDKEEVEVCPLCLRPMTSYDKQKLFAKIEGFFNKESEAYKTEISRIIEKLRQWKSLELSDIVQEIVGLEIIGQIRQQEGKFDQLLALLLSAYEKKRSNIYGTSSFSRWRDLESEQSIYASLIEKANESIKKYNSEVEHIKQLRQTLIGLNKQINAKKLKSDFEHYCKKNEKEQKCREDFNSIKKQIETLHRDISSIEVKMKQVNIALEFINEALSYIFFHKKRMVLEIADGKYVLKSNGRDVKPKDVSTGERNAIALCYFFAKIFENHQKNNRYTDENLVVLDDPVTSFDKDNKVGIMSFLRWQIDALYHGNSNTKMLIMSHDLSSVFQLQKVSNDIAENNYKVCELIDKRLEDRGIFKNKRNEYKKIMDEVFDMANGSHGDILSIGNKMRRMEEAYSSFIFNNNFERLLHNDSFLQKVPESKRTFFKSLMSRLILNTESHTEEKIYDMHDFTPMFEEEEIRKTAKYLLILFYYVDPFHLKSYLGSDNFSEVEKWKED